MTAPSTDRLRQAMTKFTPPTHNCRRCPRLNKYLRDHRKSHPHWHNAPVDSIGSLDASVLIIGLAPGLKGANATGRPFTGDSAGGYLYQMLCRYNLATGTYDGHAEDGVTLLDVRITNAVRCVPPQNKPTAVEATKCRPFLQKEIGAMSNLQQILALGRLAHEAVLRCFEEPLGQYPFSHGSDYTLQVFQGQTVRLLSSYHCSRYNTQTGRLTDDMFCSIFDKLTKRA